jgi:hypothetical protein
MGSIGWGPKRIQSEVSASHYNDGRAKSHVGFVNPVHFLHATTPDDQRLNHIVDQAGQLDKEKLSKEVQSPFFEVRDGKIVSHEGRHRMSALAWQGYTSVPVTIYHGKGSNLDPADSVTLQPQFKGRDPVTVSNLVSLHHDYDDQINDMMKQQPEHFQDGGDVDGITAYHGSPHDFDKFDTSKIGTGEGAQAYGHGLYFAENEPIAKGYRDALSANQPTPIKVGEERHHPYSPMQRIVAEHKGDVDAVLKKMMPRWEKIAETHRNLSPDTENLERYLVEDEHNEAQKQRAEVESMRGKTVEYGPKGHMYEVHIDAHPDHMLDWDKPFDNQSQHVQRALTTGRNAFSKQDLEDIQKMYGKYNGNFGAAFHEFLQFEYPSIKNQKMASNWLSKRGIHGIKYLDAGSRGATDQPNHNYVVFDHNRVNVKRKYEQGGFIRRAYMKGGKVEGSIWHNKDADLQYRGLSGSEIVEHALNKIAAPLPASILHQGSVTGRRH